jgi:hypothetical protein
VARARPGAELSEDLPCMAFLAPCSGRTRERGPQAAWRRRPALTRNDRWTRRQWLSSLLARACAPRPGRARPAAALIPAAAKNCPGPAAGSGRPTDIRGGETVQLPPRRGVALGGIVADGNLDAQHGSFRPSPRSCPSELGTAESELRVIPAEDALGRGGHSGCKTRNCSPMRVRPPPHRPSGARCEVSSRCGCSGARTRFRALDRGCIDRSSFLAGAADPGRAAALRRAGLHPLPSPAACSPHGFARLACLTCRAEVLVPFSYRSRVVCPS